MHTHFFKSLFCQIRKKTELQRHSSCLSLRKNLLTASSLLFTVKVRESLKLFLYVCVCVYVCVWCIYIYIYIYIYIPAHQK